MNKSVRIGNFSGFWGDEPAALKRQLQHAKVDYLVGDYLAEVSMSILHKQLIKKPELGYVPDFIDHLKLAKDFLTNDMPKIITNAGGKNPVACALKVQQFLSELGLQKKVMAVSGDDILDRLDELSVTHSFENMETHEPFDQIKGSVAVANAYTNSEGIIKALEAGADIVITGRASDSALTIGPLVFELGWPTDDWDKMAAAMVAGHVLECGAQACGGNFTDWQEIKNWDNFGFPIIEMDETGTFKVTKAPGTGGLVNQWSVKEQLVYEINDPQAYMGPDVVADLTTMVVEDIGADEVKVSSVTGKPTPDTWKVSMAYQNGYKATGTVVVGGRNADEKAVILEKVFWDRIPFEFEKTATNRIGYDALGTRKKDSEEILLQFTVFDHDRKKLETFSKEIAGLILSGPQGLAASGGRPRVQEVVSYWPTLVNKTDLKLEVHEIKSDGTSELIASLSPKGYNEKYAYKRSPLPSTEAQDISQPIDGYMETDMVDLCLARSGDKGDNANIGVLARSHEAYDFLDKHLTDELLIKWFQEFCKGEVVRYELPNIQGFNFFLTKVLDGGGTYSGRIDPQGKMLASHLLKQKVWVPSSLLKHVNPK